MAHGLRARTRRTKTHLVLQRISDTVAFAVALAIVTPLVNVSARFIPVKVIMLACSCNFTWHRDSATACICDNCKDLWRYRCAASCSKHRARA